MKPVCRYNKKAKKILELGVGIGEVLTSFSEKYDIYGLDIEKDYIDYCKRNIQRGKFFVSSMHNFQTDEKFDVIFSVFDSINFLETFTQWKATFKTVNDHLNRNGLFIFDMYTPKVLKAFKGKPATTEEFPIGYLINGAIVRGNKLTCGFKILEKIAEDTCQINEYKFTEVVHRVPKVKSALSKHFEILETKPLKDNRILFVCRKRRVRPAGH